MMNKQKLYCLLVALTCATATWAQTSVSTDEGLRTAIQNNNANITLTADIDLSNSTLEITNNRTVPINLGGYALDRKLTQRGDNGGQVITVRNGATLILKNGTLQGGWGGDGGGLLNEGGIVTLTNVNITGNTADDRGGGISNHGTLTMTGGSITNNISNDGTDPKGGGGIMNSEGATATLTNVTITGNTVNVTGGGGICNYGTMTLDGCTVTGNSCKMNGGGIWNKGTLKMQGVITVTGNTTANSVTNNLFLKTDAVVTVTSSLTGSNVGIIMEKPGVFTSGYSTYNSGVDPADIFKAEDEAYQIVLKGEEANFFGKLITVTTEDELRTAVKTENANIKMANDIPLAALLEITAERTITLDMDGHALDRGLTQRGNAGQVITVRKGATLNLSNGTLKGGWGGNGGGLCNEGGTVTLTNVNITGNTADDRGGGISNQGTLTMTGGSLTGNISRDGTDPKGGGGLFNYEGATATLTNVTITGNTVTYYGGGGICNFGTLTIDGGSITGNTAGTHGGGIWQEGTLSMQGTIRVEDNLRSSGLKDNLYLYSDKVVTVTGALTGSFIGVCMRKPGTFTSGYPDHNTAHPSNIFSPDLAPQWQTGYDANNEACLVNEAPSAISYIERSWDAVNKKVVSTRKQWNPGEYTVLESSSSFLEITGGKYLVRGDVTIDGILRIEGSGSVDFLLADNSSLNVTNIYYDDFSPGSLISFYAEEGGGDLGKVHADGTHTTMYSEFFAIGGSSLAFHGGDIYAKGSVKYAGIGGGSGVTVSIYSGNIQAYGHSVAAGIGARDEGEDYGTINIYGGTIHAEGGYWSKYGTVYVFDGGPGIGGAYGTKKGTLHIYGGDITAIGHTEAAGIGASQWSDCAGTIIIDGGHVEAYGQNYSAGIGGGDGVDGYKVEINGGEVYAYGGEDAAGIGGGEGGNAGTITITGGYVYAEGGHEYGAGIGGGEDGNGGNITITGGTVIAKSGTLGGPGMRGIGPGGGSDDYGSLTIGDGLMVSSWDCGEGPFPAAERKDYCWHHTQARLEPCTHASITYTVSGSGLDDTHTPQCAYCTTVFPAEQHTFVNNVCTVCGVTLTEETHTVSYYLPGNEGYGEPTVFKYIKGQTITLPTASDDNVPDNLTFAGWHVGAPAAQESIVKQEGESLVAAGTEYTVDADVSFAARYDYIHLTLANAAHNGEMLARYNGKQAQDVTLKDRTLYRDGRWNTLCLPFNVNAFDGSPLEGATVKTLSSTSFDNGTLTLNFSDNVTSIEAGKPYIVKWETTQEDITDPVFNGAIINTALNPVKTMTTGAPEGTKITFAGAYSPMFIGMERKNLLYLGPDNTLYYPDQAMTIGSCRGHFRLQGIEAGDPTDQTSNIREFVMNFDSVETTGISLTPSPSPKGEGSENWYDLQGRKLSGKPTKKGVYILNGKKRVIK